MAKVRTNFNPAKKDLKRFKREAGINLQKTYDTEVLREIAGGRSPVDGKRLKRYSESYRDRIRRGGGDFSSKKRSPVNMYLSGEMIKSFFVKIIRNGLSIGFDNELADIHNRQGAGKSKVIRRLLPTKKGEQFSRSIRKRVREVLTQTANKIFKR